MNRSRQLHSIAFAASIAFASTVGCEKKPETAPDAGSSSTAVATKPDATAATPVDAGSAMTATTDAGAAGLHMSNCPTAATGAEVAIKDVEGGVEVTITGKDDATTKDIRDRSKKLVEADKNDGGAHHHDHSGSGGGMTGRCTIIMRSTKVATADVPNGTKFTVTAKDKSEVDWVRRETRDRDKEAKSAAGAGAGPLRMVHCPSAVEGAKTSVKDTKDGAIVTVTTTGADKITEIKARAKHTADVAKKSDSTRVQHSGEGTGNGAVGRCPVVVEGDTTVDVKDIEGGVEIEVKTKKDVAALQKEVKARAANFGAR